jgi:hypothetical protein
VISAGSPLHGEKEMAFQFGWGIQPTRVVAHIAHELLGIMDSVAMRNYYQIQNAIILTGAPNIGPGLLDYWSTKYWTGSP